MSLLLPVPIQTTMYNNNANVPIAPAHTHVSSHDQSVTKFSGKYCRGVGASPCSPCDKGQRNASNITFSWLSVGHASRGRAVVHRAVLQRTKHQNNPVIIPTIIYLVKVVCRIPVCNPTMQPPEAFEPCTFCRHRSYNTLVRLINQQSKTYC